MFYQSIVKMSFKRELQKTAQFFLSKHLHFQRCEITPKWLLDKLKINQNMRDKYLTLNNILRSKKKSKLDKCQKIKFISKYKCVREKTRRKKTRTWDTFNHLNHYWDLSSRLSVLVSVVVLFSSVALGRVLEGGGSLELIKSKWNGMQKNRN